MKTFIIATILSVGVLLRPQMAPTGNNVEISYTTTVTSVASVHGAAPRLLERGETASIQGGGVVECYSYYDANYDEHGTCCLNLWFFRLCFDVNVSEVGRLISSLF